MIAFRLSPVALGRSEWICAGLREANTFAPYFLHWNKKWIPKTIGCGWPTCTPESNHFVQLYNNDSLWGLCMHIEMWASKDCRKQRSVPYPSGYRKVLLYLHRIDETHLWRTNFLHQYQLEGLEIIWETFSAWGTGKVGHRETWNVRSFFSIWNGSLQRKEWMKFIGSTNRQEKRPRMR